MTALAATAGVNGVGPAHAMLSRRHDIDKVRKPVILASEEEN
jgi:hypothetical protein